MEQLSLLERALTQPEPSAALYPTPTCRATDGGAARDAALAAVPRADNDRGLVLAAHFARPEGMTDHEMAQAVGREQVSVGVRRGELTKTGLIAPLLDAEGRQVRRAKLPGSTVKAGVWCITEAGCEIASRLDRRAA